MVFRLVLSLLQDLLGESTNSVDFVHEVLLVEILAVSRGIASTSRCLRLQWRGVTLSKPSSWSPPQARSVLREQESFVTAVLRGQWLLLASLQ